MSLKMKNTSIYFGLILLATGFQYSFAQTSTNNVVKQQTKTITMNQNSQKKIDSISEKTAELLNEYRLVVEETENLKSYNSQLVKVIDSQLEDAKAIAEQIKGIETTNRRVIPLMIKMIASLEEFVALDVPFLEEERKNRVASLKSMMNKADVSTSEKYRRVMEAFQIENEYGRTIETYSDTVMVDGKELTVEFLRVGRVALMYRSLDGELASYWNNDKKKWEEIDGSYLDQIKDGINIAKKFKAPNLITIPLNSLGAK